MDHFSVTPTPPMHSKSDPLGDHLGGRGFTKLSTNLSVLNELPLVWLWRSDYMCSLESTHLSDVYSFLSGVFGGRILI